MTELRIRQAVRGLMIDPADRILLVRLAFDDGFDGWVLPGGGIEDGETHREALIRELTEETGVPDVFMGPALWDQTSIVAGIDNGRWDGQRNVAYLVPCHAFELAPTMSAAELAEEHVVDLRWWTMNELRVTDAVLRPVEMVDLIERVLEFGAPPAPWDLGTFTPLS